MDRIDSRPCLTAGFRINGVENSDINVRGDSTGYEASIDSCGSVIAEHGKQQQHSQTDSYHHGAAEPFIGQQPWYVQVNQHMIACG